MSIYLTTWRQWVQELVCRQKWSRTSCDTFCDNHPLELCFPFEAVIILKPLNFLLQRCDWLTVWTASPQIPETCDPNAGLWWWSCWELQKKKQGKKNTPRRSSTSDRVVIGSLCWIWLTKGMTRVFYDQALSKVKQNYCDQQNSLSSNGKRTLSAWMRLKHNQISVKLTKFIFYFIFWFCFVLFFHTYITNLVYRQYLLHRFLLQQTGYIRVEGLLWIKTEGDIKYTSSLHILWSGATVGRA